MRIYLLAFKPMKGRKQYDLILNMYSIEEKIFKIVADQAANMKKAL
jgi:hypothetical protein